MSDILTIGGSAIAAYQHALGTVSNNIANLNTEGYSRQDVALAANTPENRANIYLGSGVVINGVTRAYNEFAVSSLRSSFSALNTQEPLVQYSNRIVDVMGSAKSGLTTALDQFFSSARAVSATPASIDVRGQFMTSADGIAGRLRELSGQLQGVETDTREEIQAGLSKINTITSQLATINGQLRKNSSVARQSPVLLDQRDHQLNELSKIAGITVTAATNGEITVSLGSSAGRSVIISGTQAKALGAVFGDSSSAKVDILIDPYGKRETVNNLDSGSIAGLISFRQQALEPAQSQLDALTQVFATEVNKIQTTGIDGRGQVGKPLYSIAPAFQLDSPQAHPGISVGAVVVDPVATRYHDIALSYDDAKRVWTATDTVSKQSVKSTPNSGELTINGMQITVSPAPQAAITLTLKAFQRPAATIRLAQTDPMSIAAGALFRVTPGAGNIGASSASLNFETNPAAAGGPAQINRVLVNNANNAASIQIVNSPASPLKGVATLPAGFSDIELQLKSVPESSLNLQVLTRDGRQLLGTPLDAAQQQSLLTTQNGFIAGAGFSADYLNKTGKEAYRGLDLFYGARALPGGNPAFSQANNLVDLRNLDSQLEGGVMPAPAGIAGSTYIAAGALSLNGIRLDALLIPGGGSLLASDVAEWINRQQVQGVTAVSQADGSIKLRSAGEIRLGIGANGAAADLAKLGFRAGAYMNGSSTEDLLVFQTGIGTGQLAASYRTGGVDALASQRMVPLTVKFTTSDSYSITDSSSGQVIAERSYDSKIGIRYGDLTLHFDSAPARGDQFTLDGNRDGTGSNENILRMAALETRALMPQSLTIGQAYNSVLISVGNVSGQAQIAQQALTVVNQQAVQARDKVSGVNLDNEAADLIRFQQAYQAAAKTMQIATQLFDTIIQIR